MKHKTYLSKIDQLHKTVEYYLKNSWYYEDDSIKAIYLGIFKKNHKLYKKGDFCIVEQYNGSGERYPIYSVSSIGAKINSYYISCFRWKESKFNHKYKTFKKVVNPTQFAGDIKLIEMPDELKTMSLFDPTFQRFVESYAQDLSKVG